MKEMANEEIKNILNNMYLMLRKNRNSSISYNYLELTHMEESLNRISKINRNKYDHCALNGWV